MNEKNLSMKWFKFYVYFRLPFSIILNLVSIIMALFNPNPNIFMNILYGICLVYDSFVLFSILTKKDFSYMLNIILLVMDCLVSGLDIAFSNSASHNLPFLLVSFLGFALLILVWAFPNYIYFSKRKEAFVEQ